MDGWRLDCDNVSYWSALRSGCGALPARYVYYYGDADDDDMFKYSTDKHALNTHFVSCF
jgi:hypothetical protein